MPVTVQSLSYVRNHSGNHHDWFSHTFPHTVQKERDRRRARDREEGKRKSEGYRIGRRVNDRNTLDFYLRHPDCKTAICVQVEAFQWAWNFTYPNGKNVVGLLRVPQDTPIVLNVTSSDVFHSFSIQALRIKTDAIRGRYNVIWFNVPGTCPSYGKSGFCEYRIQCFELCGLGHAFMTGRLIVMPPTDFTNYYSSSGP
ncbi:hypothetical protein E6H16_10490 [Candidatus Bathyarchaeota archaeon]|nr:MAG: hypothetical protein E6H16_10490 [Candidatus Bathyarchaeota archaeon]